MTKKSTKQKAEPVQEEVAPAAPENSLASPVEPATTPERELEETRKAAEEYRTRLLYLQADVENYRKRAERDVEQAVRFANEGLVARLLPLLDDLDAAVASVPGEEGKGYAMLRENLVKVLREAGLEEIPAAGARFDPYLHDCVQQVENGGLPDGTVKEVVRKGYRFQSRVLRPAQVIVVNNGGGQNA